jgi:hypothetical protein
MNTGSVLARPVPPSCAFLRRSVIDREEKPTPSEHAVSCDCGFIVRSARNREEHVALLLGAGWTVIKGGMRCPECSAGVIRRVVIGSQGDPYVVRHFGDTWRCSCLGYAYRKRCWHADALEKETKEKERLVAAAADFLNEAEAGAMVSAVEFLASLGDEARHTTVEACHAVLAVVLEGYRRVCVACNGEGGEAHVVGGREEPIYESYRCSHCEGEGKLHPPRLAAVEYAMPIAAE